MLEFKLLDDGRWYIIYLGLYFRACYHNKRQARYRWYKLRIEICDEFIKDHFVADRNLVEWV